MPTKRSRLEWILPAWLIAIAIAGLVYLLLQRESAGLGYLLPQRQSAPQPAAGPLRPFENTPIESWPIDPETAAPSPEGLAMVYPLRSKGIETLRLHAIDESVVRDVSTPAPVRYRSLLYSPDGQWIYAVVSDSQGARPRLQRQPASGGSPKAIADGVVGSFAISPDSTRLAYLGHRIDGRSGVYIAAADGSDPREFTVLSGAARDDDAVAWSPDGTMLALTVADSGGVQLIDSQSGEPRGTMFAGMSGFCGVSWLPSRALVACARAEGAPRRQLWIADYPGGEPRRLGVESSDYRGAKVSRNGQLLVSTALIFHGEIAIVSAGESARPRMRIGVSEDQDLWRDPSWGRDGRLVYVFSSRLWTINSDGRGSRQLTTGRAKDAQPIITPDGRTVVFVSTDGDVTGLWRAGMGVEDRVPIHAGPVIDPILSIDGRLVYWTDDARRVWRVSIDGGTPEAVFTPSDGDGEGARGAPVHPTWPKISPDGRRVALAVADAGGRYGRIEVIGIDGSGRRSFTGEVDLSLWHAAAWSASGRAFVYASQREAPLVTGTFGMKVDASVWAQEVDGGPPRLLARTSASLVDMTFSPDLTEVLLITGGPRRMLTFLRDVWK